MRGVLEGFELGFVLFQYLGVFFVASQIHALIRIGADVEQFKLRPLMYSRTVFLP